MTKVRRDYKDTMFRLLFKEKKNLLSLYNAVNGTNYTDEGSLLVTTLENAVYMNMKNDMSFVFDFQMMLYEHQSSINPNMPLRDLFYVARVLQTLVKDCDLYGSRLIRIPAPRFVVFYNGIDEQPDYHVLKLSHAFERSQDEPELELNVAVYNINLGRNPEIMATCRLLRQYAQYVKKIREYIEDFPLAEAVRRTVEECIQEGILQEFLEKNRAEAIAVSIFEYNEEEHIRNERETAYERGMEKGMEKGITMFILDNREEKISEDRICEKLMKRFELTEEKAQMYLNTCVKGRD